MARKKTRLTDEGHIDIIPMGQVDPLAVSVVAANLQTVLGLNARTLPNVAEPEEAFVPLRNQYSAGKILKALDAETGTCRFRLGITRCDICTPILKFVFGESQLGGKTAVISLHRLAHGTPSLTYERAAKIGLHETAHLLGIGHCRAPDCLMDGALSVEKIDAIPFRFCEACEFEISRSLKSIFARGK